MSVVVYAAGHAVAQPGAAGDGSAPCMHCGASAWVMVVVVSSCSG